MIDSVKQKGKGDRAMKKIAFIGLGIMGKSMARNVMKKGYELNIYIFMQGPEARCLIWSRRELYFTRRFRRV